MVVYNHKKIVFLVSLLVVGSLGQLGATGKLPTGNETVQHSVHRATATTAVANSTRVGLTNGTEEMEEAKPKETFAQVRWRGGCG